VAAASRFAALSEKPEKAAGGNRGDGGGGRGRQEGRRKENREQPGGLEAKAKTMAATAKTSLGAAATALRRWRSAIGVSLSKMATGIGSGGVKAK
jgi:hypothetical protein